MDSTHYRSKIFGKKILENYKKENLNLPHAGNYLPIIYIVLSIISNLEVI